jgi:RNA binding exosome subunit
MFYFLDDSDVVFKILGKKIEKQGKYYLKVDKSKVIFDTNG